MNGKFQVKDQRMLKYKSLINILTKLFKRVKFEKIRRLDNKATGELAKLAYSAVSTWEIRVPVHYILRPSTIGRLEIVYIEENTARSGG